MRWSKAIIRSICVPHFTLFIFILWSHKNKSGNTALTRGRSWAWCEQSIHTVARSLWTVNSRSSSAEKNPQHTACTGSLWDIAHKLRAVECRSRNEFPQNKGKHKKLCGSKKSVWPNSMAIGEPERRANKQLTKVFSAAAGGHDTKTLGSCPRQRAGRTWRLSVIRTAGCAQK